MNESLPSIMVIVMGLIFILNYKAWGEYGAKWQSKYYGYPYTEKWVKFCQKFNFVLGFFMLIGGILTLLRGH